MEEDLIKFFDDVVDHLTSKVPAYALYMVLGISLLVHYQSVNRDTVIIEHLANHQKVLYGHQYMHEAQLKLDSAWNDEFNRIQMNIMQLYQVNYVDTTLEPYTLLLTDTVDTVTTVYYNPVIDSIPTCSN